MDFGTSGFFRPVDRLYESGELTFGDLETRDHRMAVCLERARKAAAGDAEVLIVGETGTGKNLIALAMHNASPRRGKPFYPINVAEISEFFLEF